MLDQAFRDLIVVIREGKKVFLEKQFQKIKSDYVKAKEPKLIDKGLVSELFVQVCKLSPLNDDAILLATNILYLSKEFTISNMSDLVRFYNDEILKAYSSVISDPEVMEWTKIALFRSCSNDLLPSMHLLNELKDFCIPLSDGGHLINPIRKFRFISRIVEGILKVFQSRNPELENGFEGWFFEWIQENLYSSDDLLLHKNKDLIVCLLIQYESCRISLLDIVFNLEDSLKVKYQIITELIVKLKKIYFETGSSPFALKVPTDFLVNAKEVIDAHIGLRPAISDAFVAMIAAPVECVSFQVCLLDFVFDDKVNKAAKYLIPRLLKGHPESLKKLARTFKVSHEESLEVYILIVMSICEMDGSDVNSCLEKSVLRTALSHCKDEIRLGMFGCLCKSFGVNRKISFDFLHLIKTFIWHLFLESSSDLRQKTLNFFQILLTSLLARLYALIRDEGKVLVYSGESIAESMESLQLSDEKEMLVKWIHDLIDLLFIGMTSEESHRFGSVEFGVRALLEIEMAVQLRNRSKALRTSSKSDEILDEYIANFMEKIREKGKSILIKIALNNAFTSNRTLAAEALTKLNIIDGTEVEIEKEALKRLRHPRECVSEGAATVLAVLQEGKRINNERKGNYDYELFVELLDEQLALTKEKLAIAASENNFNGTLCLLTKLIRQQRAKNAEAEMDNGIAKRIISLCQEICNVVSAVASQPSPEGSDLGQFFDHTGTIPMSETSRLILTFCWRAIKESTNLIGEMIALKFYNDQGGIQSTLDFLVDLILSLRHPGAFTALESPINMICKVLISSSSDYPEKVLSASIDDCLHHPEIQTTRRSAGLPLCINAILSAYPKTDLRPITIVMEAMFGVLNDYDLSLLNQSPSIVHALNIIKSIFRDANLAEQCASFVGESFRLCFRSFKSASWAVRNGAMMLFGALVRRAFGSKEASLIDLRTIAQNYPGLLTCFEEELNSVGQGTEESKDKYIYPLLSILQRMKFSSGAITSFPSFFNSTCTFIFDSCVPAKSLKIRRIASRIVIESLLLACPEILWPILKEKCLGKNLQARSCNELHGKLLLILEMHKINSACLMDEDIELLKMYFSSNKVPSVIRHLSLSILNRAIGFVPSESDVLAEIDSIDRLEPYQFELISSMMQLSGLGNPQKLADAIMNIRFEGLRFSLITFLMETTMISPSLLGSIYKPLQGKDECNRSLLKHHFGYEIASLKQQNINIDELYAALQKYPRNPDVVRAVLNASAVLADAEKLLEVVEGIFEPSQQHTDLVRLIAVESLGKATGLQPSFSLLRLMRAALTDDDEDVRHAACISYGSLFSAPGQSVAAVLTRLHELMRQKYPNEYQNWISTLTVPNSVPKENDGILFLKEEENMFVNWHWELAPFTKSF